MHETAAKLTSRRNPKNLVVSLSHLKQMARLLAHKKATAN